MTSNVFLNPRLSDSALKWVLPPSDGEGGIITHVRCMGS